ncbi:hypothetical protein [Streptomyces sp. C10]|uniref:hypothetical protein n=1 Tax=Streptomyces sp. C10 TaxID=531941 RepID=UPI003980C40F
MTLIAGFAAMLSQGMFLTWPTMTKIKHDAGTAHSFSSQVRRNPFQGIDPISQ